MPKGSPELLRHWLSEGYNSQAVAGYGTSVEFLERALTTGKIPWGLASTDQNLLPYQKEILATGGYLYFIFPFAENLRIYKPSLIQKLEEEDDLSYGEIQRHLKIYAGWRAIEDRFESLVEKGPFDRIQIIALTHNLFPTLVTQFKNDAFLKDILSLHSMNWQNPPQVGLEDLNITLPHLKEILAQSISRRGIILYYNRGILRNQILGGFEHESELLIHSQKPLALDVISGTEALSKTDQEALESLTHKFEVKKS